MLVSCDDVHSVLQTRLQSREEEKGSTCHKAAGWAGERVPGIGWSEGKNSFAGNEVVKWISCHEMTLLSSLREANPLLVCQFLMRFGCICHQQIVEDLTQGHSKSWGARRSLTWGKAEDR